ncbi:tachylectin-related carbohydrate-binding protein [Phycicoccus sp. Soil803]|uniref:tachylectin-related carbohydrate-binding protein n=1 Tax=Phycicoccus sp. Soil803 TaxID=1736415 RepID=UPI00138F250E|nr:tachylectin-related carbohydrate-binding protein [Phycicoccus sp. Soil803]
MTTRTLAALVATTVAGALGLGLAPTAHAADATTCAVTAPVFAVDAGGTLFRYPFRDAATSTAKFGARTAIGSGWQVYGKVIAGGSGWVYALKSDGLYVYHRTPAGTWDVQRRHFGFLGEYAASSRSARIVADQRGTIYTLTDAGAVQAYRFDADHTGLVAVRDLVLEADPTRNALVGAGDGVLYVRHKDGALDRMRYEATSDRIISTVSRVGAGWNIFSRLFSPGGDVLLGQATNGDLFQYRYREDTRTWVITKRKVGAGWQVMRQATATSDSCWGDSFVPEEVAPTTAGTDRPGIAAVPQSSEVDVVAPDRTQGVVWGRYDGVTGGMQQAPLPFPAAVGTPSVTRLADGRMSVLTTGPDGQMHGALQVPYRFGLTPPTDEGGRMATSPASASIGSVAFHFAIDPQGALWVKRQLHSTGDFLPWHPVGVTGLAAKRVMVKQIRIGDTGGLGLGVITPSGQLRLGTYDGTRVTSWTTVAEGAAGTPDLLVYPGGNDGVLTYRGTDGLVHARMCPLRAGGRSGPWQTLAGQTEGDPAVSFGAHPGKSVIVARSSSGGLVGAEETGELSGTWGAWVAQTSAPVGTAGSDPATADNYSWANAGEPWLVVQSVLAQNGAHRQLSIPTPPYFP